MHSDVNKDTINIFTMNSAVLILATEMWDCLQQCKKAYGKCLCGLEKNCMCKRASTPNSSTSDRHSVCTVIKNTNETFENVAHI